MALTPEQKEKRAQTSRQNGAKSRGPKTEKGLHRCASASYKHGLYSVRGCMLPGESNEEYAALQGELHAYFQPFGFFDRHLVEKLVAVIWESNRLEAAKNDHVHNAIAQIEENNPDLRDQARKNLSGEIEVSVQGGKMMVLQARPAHLSRERSRLETEIWNAKKRAPAYSGGSQMSFSINRRQHPGIPETAAAQPVDGKQSEGAYTVEATTEPLPPPFTAPVREPETTGAPEAWEDILSWAANALDFHPDSIQEQILTETNKRIIVLAPRQTGKSTAAAVRVIHEAVHHDNCTILLASASGRQSGQILQKARQLALSLNLELFGPPAQCEGFTLANGASVIALPDSQQTIRGFSAPRLIIVDEAAYASPDLFKALEPMLTVSNGTLMLLSTPNGQSGFFYEKWHEMNSSWARIFGRLEDCPRVSAEAIESIRKSMSEADFQQEFECKFVAAGGQFISLETFRKCLRDDFELFLPEFDNDDNFDDL